MEFKSLPRLLDYFKDEKTCIEYYEKLRWNGKAVCPHCASKKQPYKTNRGYRCSNNQCYKKFTVKVGTIFHSSKIPFRIWFAAIYLCSVHKKGISSVQLAIDLSITQKTAWFVLHRVRELLKDKSLRMIGKNNIVEADETHIGGKEKNRHRKKRQSKKNEKLANDGTIYNKKKVVVGIIERNGNIVLKYVAEPTRKNIVPFIKKHVPKGSSICTDESKLYHRFNKTYKHNKVNHQLKLYVKGATHTNTIENFWSVLKRGLYGTYHQVSEKHLNRYLNEFSGRFNERNLPDACKFEKFLTQSKGRLTYNNLIANNNTNFVV